MNIYIGAKKMPVQIKMKKNSGKYSLYLFPHYIPFGSVTNRTNFIFHPHSVTNSLTEFENIFYPTWQIK